MYVYITCDVTVVSSILHNFADFKLHYFTGVNYFYMIISVSCYLLRSVYQVFKIHYSLIIRFLIHS